MTIKDTAQATQTIREFTQKFCSPDESLVTSLENNYQNCYKLAEEWAEGVKDWINPNAGDSLSITDAESAIKATQCVIDLIRTANECRKDHFNMVIDNPRIALPVFAHMSEELRENYLKWGKINSIKRIRELTHCGLREAKDFMEAFVLTDEALKRNLVIKDVMT